MNKERFNESVILMELRECHEYIRPAFGLYVGWFTFFLTTIFAGT
jgi:hypothetical protein